MSQSNAKINREKSDQMTRIANAGKRVLPPSYLGSRPMISYISPDMVHADFTDSLCALLQWSGDAGINYAYNRTRSTMLEIGRGVQAHLGIIKECSHILFLDSDMMFPRETLGRLLSHGLDIVGCTYSQRHSPRGYTHRSMTGDYNVPLDLERDTFEVKSMGLGCCLIKTEVFKAIERPWFPVRYLGGVRDDGADAHTSEDIAFFEKATAAGFKAWCDWPLSQEIKHVGMFQFGLEHTEVLPGYIED